MSMREKKRHLELKKFVSADQFLYLETADLLLKNVFVLIPIDECNLFFELDQTPVLLKI